MAAATNSGPPPFTLHGAADPSGASPHERFKAEQRAVEGLFEKFEAKAPVLSEEITHPVEEEEMPHEGMFAQAAKADVDLVDPGGRMAARCAEPEAEFKKNGLPIPLARALCAPKVVLGEPVS